MAHPLTAPAPFFDRNHAVEKVHQALSDPKNVNTNQLIKALFFLTNDQVNKYKSILVLGISIKN